MKRQLWIPLALGIVATYIFLDRRAARHAAEYDEMESAADRTALWGSKQRIAGTGRDLLGKVKEGVGRITGDDDLAGRGVVDQVAGSVQDTAGKAANAASDTMRDFNRY
ncbi:MAG TPA: CsbD family protein [Acidobacteriaceae bacterium]|nr:CsbD family protein [Acidobacteriaceae bacterium]